VLKSFDLISLNLVLIYMRICVSNLVLIVDNRFADRLECGPLAALQDIECCAALMRFRLAD